MVGAFDFRVPFFDLRLPCNSWRMALTISDCVMGRPNPRNAPSTSRR